MTAYEPGRGVAVVVFETRDQAEQLANGLHPEREIRAGVVATRIDVLEVSAGPRDTKGDRFRERP